jgi:hypothetical protein
MFVDATISKKHFYSRANTTSFVADEQNRFRFGFVGLKEMKINKG